MAPSTMLPGHKRSKESGMAAFNVRKIKKALRRAILAPLQNLSNQLYQKQAQYGIIPEK